MKRVTLNLLQIAIIISFFILPARAYGQQAVSPRITVAPHTFELDVFPGEVRHEKIKIFNQSEVAIPISTRITDFTAEEESGQMIFDESVADPSIAARKWIKIGNPKLMLDPGEKGEVKFSIEVPENAEPGGHYAIILFEATLPSFYFEENQLRAIPTLGVLFLLSVKTFALEPIPIDQQIKIVEFGIPKEQRLENLEKAFRVVLRSVSRGLASINLAYAAQTPEIRITEKTPSSFILRIKNNDIFHHKLEGKLLILNTFGKKVGETQVKRTTILPGKIRRFPVEFEPEIPEKLDWLPASISDFLLQNTSLGAYRVVLGLSEEKSALSINQAMNFWAFPWKIILPLFLLVGLLILMRKRITAALKTLLKPSYYKKRS